MWYVDFPHTLAAWSGTLAQQNTLPGQATQRIFTALGVLVVAAVVVIAVALVLRRWFLRSSDSEMEGFTLSDIRQLHREGAISDEEFQATRSLLVAKGRSQLADEAPAAAEEEDGEEIPDSADLPPADEAGPDPDEDDDAPPRGG